MTAHESARHETYDPNRLLDAIIEQLNLKNDAALCRVLEVAPPLISKIRHRRLPVGASMLIRMHEVTALNIKTLRELMGDRRNKLRISDKDQLNAALPARSGLQSATAAISRVTQTGKNT